MGLRDADTSVDERAGISRYRFLRFPAIEGRPSLGVLLTRPRGAGGDHLWKALDEARGVVEVPPGFEVKLRVNSRALRDLTALEDLAPDDLHTLDMVDADITDGQLGYLAGLTDLRELILARTGIGDEGLAYITCLSELRCLNLYGTRVTDSGLRALVALPRLETLWLNKSLVSNIGLASLKQMSSLRELFVEDTKISYVGRTILKKELPNCRIKSGKGSIWSY